MGVQQEVAVNSSPVMLVDVETLAIPRSSTFSIQWPFSTPSPSIKSAPRTPKSPFSIMTPLASPVKKAITSMHGYLEEIGHLTKLDPQEAWLPITESRSGSAYSAAFHTLSSGIGVQALVLPLAFTSLGWIAGVTCLTLVFVWQLYTLWLLTQLHESVPGTRYSRYLWLAMAAFGDKLGKIMALIPTMYLSGGTCVTLIIIGGGTLKLFVQTIWESTSDVTPLTTTEWYLVFTCSAIVLSQLPNLNSIAGVSLIGAITAVTYCTLTWILPLTKGRLIGVSYHPLEAKSNMACFCDTLNALGIIAFAFRGHNLVLEIQGTMPSSPKHPSHLPMWRGVTLSYLVIALCLFPLAIVGYWAYGNLIYAMPVFDNVEFRYTSNMNKPCPWWLRIGFRAFFGCLAFFIAFALPFLPSLAGLIGGIALPITLAYPCFMWIALKKPKKLSAMWLLNWALGFMGIILSILLVFGAIWSIVTKGIEVHFFKPH